MVGGRWFLIKPVLLLNFLLFFFSSHNFFFWNSTNDSNEDVPPKCTILDNWVFENFMSADELFAKDFTNPWN